MGIEFTPEGLNLLHDIVDEARKEDPEFVKRLERILGPIPKRPLKYRIQRLFKKLRRKS